MKKLKYFRNFFLNLKIKKMEIVYKLNNLL